MPLARGGHTLGCRSVVLYSFCCVGQSQGTGGLDRTEDVEKQPGARVGSVGAALQGTVLPTVLGSSSH